MAAILLVLLSFIPLYHFIDQDIANLAFVGFQRKHGKRYRDKEEESKRAAIFKANLEYIEEVNSQNLPYKLGVNEYADLSFEEFSAQMLRPIKVDEKMKEKMLVQAEDDAMDLPASVDWREKNVLNPIKNQGDCGSCWAFSATGALEAQHAIATGKLLSLSEQQLVDCSTDYGNKGCNGGIMDAAYNYTQHHGIDQESTYPYNAGDNKCQDTLAKKADGLSIGEVNGFYMLPQTDAALMKALMAAPVSIAMYADIAFQLYSSGVYTSFLCQFAGESINHGIVAVGYGTEGGEDYYLMRNSWGPSWGLNGYFKIKRGGADGDHGECNVLEYMCVATLKD
ncbi:hypothetical protein FOZ63_028046 [Perkinsus olseni]|uniref:Cathepsin L n=2 Tax=Perkinsus olseni TaxID=32597 RepID=A0A7J6QD21_PEROL|nr:hypothetical protein FOZ60_000275 [Perkinsus olseni]KAF4706112.1 hypothetical protein FOZ63_028046 [Perkinsus olseni]